MLTISRRHLVGSLFSALVLCLSIFIGIMGLTRNYLFVNEMVQFTFVRALLYNNPGHSWRLMWNEERENVYSILEENPSVFIVSQMINFLLANNLFFLPRNGKL